MNNALSWQAQVLAESRRAELLAAAEGARRSRVAHRRQPLRAAVAERAGLFLVRHGERLRRNARRHRPAPVC